MAVKALRATYTLAVGLDIIDPEGHGVDPHDDSAFTCDLFLKLKINQGGGGFCSYRERINFLNFLNNILPQVLDCTLTEGVVG